MKSLVNASYAASEVNPGLVGCWDTCLLAEIISYGLTFPRGDLSYHTTAYSVSSLCLKSWMCLPQLFGEGLDLALRQTFRDCAICCREKLQRNERFSGRACVVRVLRIRVGHSSLVPLLAETRSRSSESGRHGGLRNANRLRVSRVYTGLAELSNTWRRAWILRND
jgi:hypothetical protein